MDVWGAGRKTWEPPAGGLTAGLLTLRSGSAPVSSSDDPTSGLCAVSRAFVRPFVQGFDGEKGASGTFSDDFAQIKFAGFSLYSAGPSHPASASRRRRTTVSPLSPSDDSKKNNIGACVESHCRRASFERQTAILLMGPVHEP